MTTQELKQYIDRVLGNSIRCLLPSYWWKKLFTSLADRVDEVEQSTSKLIKNKVNEVKMPIVESEDELSKLDLPKGSVAAADSYGKINPYECYCLSFDKEPSANAVIDDWDKFKRITHIDVTYPESEPSDMPTLYLHRRTPFPDGLIQLSYYQGGYKISMSSVSLISISRLNQYLENYDYRLIAIGDSEEIVNFFNKHVSLYSPYATTELYIKGETWERLAKESDLEAVGSGDALVFGTERYAYVSRERDEAGNITESELTDEQIAYNKETVSLLASGEKVYLSYDGTFWMKYGHDISSSKSTYFFSAISMSMMSGNKLWGRMMAVSSDGSIDIVNTTISGSSITTDSELSETSTNPIQNKAVYAALQNFANDFQFSIDNKVDKTYVDNAIANAITITLNTEV